MGAVRKKLDLNPIYLEVSRLLLYKNPEQISFSLIAQKTKVPRTTLYYYFNSNIKALMTESVRFVMKDFMQLWGDENPSTSSVTSSPSSASASSFESWQQLQKYKFQKAIKLVTDNPEALKLYLRYCDHPSFIGDEIRYTESLYIKSREKDWELFHSRPLEHRMQTLIAQIKVGILWGLIGKENHWKGEEDKLAEICSKLIGSFEAF